MISVRKMIRPILPATSGRYFTAQPREDREPGDAEDRVGQVPVPAGDPAEQPGDGLGEEAEAVRQARIGMIDVGQYRRPGGEAGENSELRLRHVLDEQPDREAGDRPGKGMSMSEAHVVDITGRSAESSRD